jgi:glucan biosynthesis protein C
MTKVELPGVQKTERLHALDSLRAVLMLLGLVFHSALTYVTYENNAMWALKDPETTHVAFDLLVNYIHSFRMSLFFVVAGFFSGLLYYERSQKEMIKNRLNRLVYPFIIFVFLLWPLLHFAWVYTGTIAQGTNLSLKDIRDIAMSFPLVPSNTMHLWFLYHLIFYSIFIWILGWVLKKSERISLCIQQAYEFLMGFTLLRPFIFSLVTIAFLYFSNSVWIEKTESFMPEQTAVWFYFTFYIFGWLLYRSKKMLEGFVQFDWLFVGIASAGVFVKVIYPELLSEKLMMAVNAVVAWLFIFGFIGLFIRYFSCHSAKIRFMSDASYWFYLVHLPITALMPGLLMWVGWVVGVKFLVVLSVTTIICWISYLGFVRYSAIGLLLNGKKYLRMNNKL